MITLITGTPGAGKTLRCVEILAELRNADDPKVRNRLIFSNINGLDDSIGAVASFDPMRWMDLPEGSLIVVDECQDFWPSRPSGSKRPDSIVALNKHRHRGIDLILLTQHPGLIDQDIRPLVGRHLHAYRPRNLPHSVWYEWSTCELYPQPKLKPIPEKRTFNKEIFALYKSTVEDTHKPQSWGPIVKKALLPLVAVAGGVAMMIISFSGMAAKKESGEPGPVAQVEAGQGTELPLYQAPSGALPTLTPAAPASALPVLAYHGWQRWAGRLELLLCQEGADGRCDVSMTWDQIQYWREEGGHIVVMGGPSGPDLWIITDRALWADAIEQGIQLAQR